MGLRGVAWPGNHRSEGTVTQKQNAGDDRKLPFTIGKEAFPLLSQLLGNLEKTGGQEKSLIIVIYRPPPSHTHTH